MALVFYTLQKDHNQLMTTCIKINLRFLFLTVYSFGQNTESSAIKVRSFGYVWLKVKVLVT